MALRLVMMGTGEFALPTFRHLQDSQHTLVGLFTQPDRTGRGHHHHAHPMKEAALSFGIPVFQPAKVNTAESLEDLRSLNADLAVVAAYGQILSSKLLATPRMGAINVHASLLPKYRGAAPVQYAVLEGETETGITIFQIEPKLDAGPMLGVRKLTIGPRETAGELEDRLAALAAPLCLKVVDQLEAGAAQAILQESSQVTTAPRLKKEDGVIDWTRAAEEIERQVRGLQPWPKAYSFLDAKQPLRLILLETEVTPDASGPEASPGTVISAEGDSLIVQCGQGALRINRLQPSGKRPMAAEEFLRGHSARAGDRMISAD